MNVKIMALVAILIMAAKAQAGIFFTASDILADCESDSVTDNNNCFYYIAAVVDTEDRVNAAWKAGFGEKLVERLVFCLPKKVKGMQLQKVFIKYANENPQDLHKSASDIVMKAFMKAFSCKQP